MTQEPQLGANSYKSKDPLRVGINWKKQKKKKFKIKGQTKVNDSE